KRGDRITPEIIDKISVEKLKNLKVKDEEIQAKLEKIIDTMESQLDLVRLYYEDKINKLKRGDELQPGVLKTIKVYIAMKRKIAVGDKLSGRHGNKGIVSIILPEEDMPFMENGTPVDVVLNPLGVPSRMNVGQILETHLGWAAKELGKRIGELVNAYQNNGGSPETIREYLKKIYNDHEMDKFIDRISDEELLDLASRMKDGVFFAVPVFEGAKEHEIKEFYKLAGMKDSWQVVLYDGKTGEPFHHPVTVGYMYLLKLHHLVEDKIHARSTGPYSLVTQQPLGGKAQF
ncbi:MAG: DNA-directed RNA polymerase subunit beta, partial [Deltaproteobacteria bacterium]|nr:DNA-directed RNA polymerase subunit beta [Deltaproteobacteria bacterium]